jgi:hypothetical protein
LCDRPVDKGPLASIYREQESRKGTEEGIRQSEIQALEEEVLSNFRKWRRCVAGSRIMPITSSPRIAMLR